MRFDVLVEVALRPGIADPQGATIERALPALGFDQVKGVRTGKAIRFSLEAEGESEAQAAVDDLCRRFLTNPVIEEALVTIAPSTSAIPAVPTAIPSVPPAPSVPAALAVLAAPAVPAAPTDPTAAPVVDATAALATDPTADPIFDRVPR